MKLTCIHAKSFQSYSMQPYGLQPARLLCLWNSPGKNSGMGCHAGDLPDPRLVLASLRSPALAGGFLTTSTTQEAQSSHSSILLFVKFARYSIVWVYHIFFCFFQSFIVSNILALQLMTINLYLCVFLDEYIYR